MQNRSIRRWPRVVSWIGLLGGIGGLGYFIAVVIQGAPVLHVDLAAAVMFAAILAYGADGFLGRREKERTERTGEIMVSRTSRVYNANNRRLHDRQRVLPEDTFEPTEEVTATIQRPASHAIGPERREPPFVLRENTGGWPEVT